MFTGPVEFLGPVTFSGPVTVQSIGSELGNIGAGLVVAIEPGIGAVVADSSNINHADRIVGISLGQGRVIVAGIIGGLSGFQAGDPLFLSIAGGLSITPPSSGFQQQVAVAISFIDIVVSLRIAILI